MSTTKQKTLIEKGMLLEVKKDNEVITGVVMDLYKHKSWLQLTILDGEGTLHKCSYSLWDGSFKWQDNTVNVLAAMAFIKDSQSKPE
jgi:hypothetical protein